MKLEITFIACSKPLTEEAAARIKASSRNKTYPQVSRVYTGSCIGCREMAAMIYPGIPALLANRISGFDFGTLSGKAGDELASSPDFTAWAASPEVMPFPGGEPPHVSAALNLKEFAEIMDDLEHSNVENASIIAPKTVILIILNRYLFWGEGYPGLNIKDGGGCLAVYNTSLDSMRLLRIF